MTPGASNAFFTARATRCVVRIVAVSCSWQIEQVLRRPFRNDQRVALRLRHHVHERQRVRVFEYFLRRHLAAQDPCKDVGRVVGHEASSLAVPPG